MARILIIDDEESIRQSLKIAFERRNHQTITAATIKEAGRLLKHNYEIIFLDILLPDGNGLDLLKKILSDDPSQVVIMISGHADIDMAIDAIKTGAYDFIEKPLSLEKILVTIDNATKSNRLVSENIRLNSLVYGEFIGESQLINKLKNDIIKSASRTNRFLILGENGTGKELVANMIHKNSRFADGPFIAVNCAALPSELVESELVGHTSGAFTGAVKSRKGKFIEADNGSIFLDEISEMPLDAQAKILRVVETKLINPIGSEKSASIDCNIIAASNKDINQLVSESKFREDLLYRLNVVQFIVPPLRERLDDIPLLCRYFLDYFASESKIKTKKISKEAIEYLSAFDFPGNIRELRNLMERINIYCNSQTINRSDIEEMLPFVPKKNLAKLKDKVANFEKLQIKSAIERNGGNISKAARELGLERSHLYKKIKKLNIT
jgi:two-component system nitrogen regulation response regulator NtrX